MSTTMSRFLSKRDKSREGKPHHSLLGHSHEKHSHLDSKDADHSRSKAIDPKSAVDFYGLFCMPGKTPTSDEESKIKLVRQKIVKAKAVMPKDSQILWTLRSEFSKGDVNLASDLLIAMIDASEGMISPYKFDTRLKGAVNRSAVTCYLDATLFAMFSRLDSFEAMLYNDFQDPAKERLSFLLRIWVNLLRTGHLITVDITKAIQDALAECGWSDAKELHQQDASEAFSFITEKLNLPLLTLKMDIYHTGRQDNDDHKFINERLLEVAIPTLEDGKLPKDVRLEDCLEEYFNNRIEVKRFLERRTTITSSTSYDTKTKGGDAVHVETIELDPDTPSTPLSSTPLSSVPSYMSSERPAYRHRSASIIQERFVPAKDDSVILVTDDDKSPVRRLRKGSLRKEVLMPAWQFFSLIPWYTDNAPSNDAQVADHFSSKRPVLGLCLKRYSFTNTGRAIRLDTFVDIPIEIGLPHFIQDDKMDSEASLYGNFKLSLQSVVCHRGTSVDSGHYVALVRADPQDKLVSEEDYWLRFDDLARERVTTIDIRKALKEETPYLLFYQILPVDGDPGNLTSGEKLSRYSRTATPSPRPTSSNDEALQKVPTQSTDSTTGRPSFEINSSDDGRGRSPENHRRPSAISFPDAVPSRQSTEISAETGPTERRRSSTLNNSLGRRLSKLKPRSRGESKEEVPQAEIEPGPQIRVEEVNSEVSEPPETSAKLANNHREVLGVLENRSRSRQRREKSRSRLTKGTSKGRGEDSERECVVM